MLTSQMPASTFLDTEPWVGEHGGDVDLPADAPAYDGEDIANVKGTIDIGQAVVGLS